MILKILIKYLKNQQWNQKNKLLIMKKIVKEYQICYKKVNLIQKCFLDLNKDLLKLVKINLFLIYKMQHLFPEIQLKIKMLK